MILYGASGHAKVVLDICLKNNVSIQFVLDDNKEVTKFLGLPVSHQYSNEMFVNNEMIISVGNNGIRKKIVGRVKATFGKAIHPSSVIDKTVTIGEGSVVMANAVINSSSLIGDHCIINTSSSVDHDCFIDNFVHISPKATLCGGVHIGEGTHIGAGAVILPNVKLGKWCIIGAGTIVLKDVADHSKLVGNPGIKI